MKKLLSICLAVALMPLLGVAQKTTFVPEKPIQGESFMIQYDPSGSEISDASKVEAVAYLASSGLPEAVSVPLNNKDGIWVGKVTPAAETKAVFFKFRNYVFVVDNFMKDIYRQHPPVNGQLNRFNRTNHSSTKAPWGGENYIYRLLH